MQGDPEVLKVLGDVLAAELTAINQYFVHYRLCEGWGYKKLAEPYDAHHRAFVDLFNGMGNLLLGTSPLALNPSVDVQDVSGGAYFMQVLPSGITSPKREEWVNGQIELTATAGALATRRPFVIQVLCGECDCTAMPSTATLTLE